MASSFSHFRVEFFFFSLLLLLLFHILYVHSLFISLKIIINNQGTLDLISQYDPLSQCYNKTPTRGVRVCRHCIFHPLSFFASWSSSLENSAGCCWLVIIIIIICCFFFDYIIYIYVCASVCMRRALIGK